LASSTADPLSRPRSVFVITAEAPLAVPSSGCAGSARATV
jgi:hypothetical protein